ncbi:MAG: DNA polymerase III subunit gamma/tau [Alphaproteobacteria bacterium]|nr:DNA polymerase III subunit gamma/tau [Alphaproteobacteria bacterium]
MFGEIPAAAPAAYRVLARKYRPDNFGALIGQDVVVQTLTNAIRANRLAQAWMLTGVRGVGKTTTARIIARALNCIGTDGQGGATPDPCGVCANCVAIAADRHVDVLEMDAASRTGVDDIREIIDGVRYNPVNARYKIYIIDEVHMLSKNAFNALLKTLEEPPPQVKFIFATTEIRKVPVTVLSRCQRFDLRRVDAGLLAQHFAKVAAAEGVTVADEALTLLARAADGSVRDGLSLLDQAIARGGDQVSVTEVRAMLGLADRAQLMELTKQVLQGAMREAVAGYNDLLQLGADPLVVLQDVAELVHLLTRAKLVPDLATGTTLPELEKAFVAPLTELTIPALTRAWQILLKGMEEVQRADSPAMAAEMVLIRLAYAAALPTPGDLVKLLQQEQASASAANNLPPAGGGGGTRGNLALAVQNAAPQPVVIAAVSTAPEVGLAAMPQDFAAVVALFAARKEPKLYGELYQFAQPVKCEPGRLEICLAPQASPDLAARVGQCLTAWTGQRWVVTLARSAEAPTLAAAAAAVAAAERAAVINHPLVQKALALFPGAKIASIRPPPAVESPVTGETGADDAAEPLLENALPIGREEQDE